MFTRVRLFRVGAGALIVAAGFLAGSGTPRPIAAAVPNDDIADWAIGTPTGFTTGDCNQGLASPTARSLCNPVDAAWDTAGNLWVVDGANNRVVGYLSPLTTDRAADRVLGQPSPATNTCLAVSATSLCQPMAVTVDAAGNVYVADFGRNRVLKYLAPFTTNTTADMVFGQGGSFATSDCNLGGISASSICGPGDISVDASENVFIADRGNNRVLAYLSPSTTDTVADVVFGQGGSFTTNGVNQGGLSASSLSIADGVVVAPNGAVYIGDGGNARVLRFDSPLATDTVADQVFGQFGSFTSDAFNNGGISANSLSAVNGLELDAAGTLWVADLNNNRVLAYYTPAGGDTTADLVVGQSNFTSATCNSGGVSAMSLCVAVRLTVDSRRHRRRRRRSE